MRSLHFLRKLNKQLRWFLFIQVERVGVEPTTHGVICVGVSLN